MYEIDLLYSLQKMSHRNQHLHTCEATPFVLLLVLIPFVYIFLHNVYSMKNYNNNINHVFPQIIKRTHTHFSYKLLILKQVTAHHGKCISSVRRFLSLVKYICHFYSYTTFYSLILTNVCFTQESRQYFHSTKIYNLLDFLENSHWKAICLYTTTCLSQYLYRYTYRLTFFFSLSVC